MDPMSNGTFKLTRRKKITKTSAKKTWSFSTTLWSHFSRFCFNCLNFSCCVFFLFLAFFLLVLFSWLCQLELFYLWKKFEETIFHPFFKFLVFIFLNSLFFVHIFLGFFQKTFFVDFSQNEEKLFLLVLCTLDFHEKTDSEISRCDLTSMLHDA